MDYQAEQAAITQTIEVLLSDGDHQQRLVLIGGQMYRLTAERLVLPKDIEKATQEYLREALPQHK